MPQGGEQWAQEEAEQTVRDVAGRSCVSRTVRRLLLLQVAVDHEVPLEAMAEDTELVKADIER